MFDPRHRKRTRLRKQRIWDTTTKQNKAWFLWTLLVIMWSLTGFIFFFVDPALLRNVWLPGLYAPFFLILWLSLMITVYVFSHHTPKMWLYSSLIIVCLYLQLLQLQSWLSVLLLVLITLAFEYVIMAKKPTDKTESGFLVKSKPETE